MQVAIDGPAGAGKSTIAKLLAQKNRMIYVDTGAMYRALTLKALRTGVNLQDEAALCRLAETTQIEFLEKQNGQDVLCDGVPVTDMIRTPQVSSQVGTVASYTGVRRIMVLHQQKLAQSYDIVMDGRDIGEKVLPQADFKFFMTADPEERARRRLKEWEMRGETADFAEVLQEILRRDAQDAGREEGALKILPDSIVLDTTRLSIREAVEKMQKIIGGF